MSWAELDYHYEQQLLREQYPHADPSLIPIFEDLLDTAEEYHRLPDAPLAPIDWPSAVRLIESKYPPIDLFEDLADPEVSAVSTNGTDLRL